jgi:hypothetical protein
MSTQFKGYYGPYLRTVWGMQDRQVDRFCCANEECESFKLQRDPMSETFCPKCGRRIVSIPVTVPGKDAPPPNAAFKGLRLIHDNADECEHLWIPESHDWNKEVIKQLFKPENPSSTAVLNRLVWSREFDFSGDDARIAFPIYQLTVAQACTCFAGVFKPEIEKMQESYDKVELLMGLITWVF